MTLRATITPPGGGFQIPTARLGGPPKKKYKWFKKQNTVKLGKNGFLSETIDMFLQVADRLGGSLMSISYSWGWTPGPSMTSSGVIRAPIRSHRGLRWLLQSRPLMHLICIPPVNRHPTPWKWNAPPDWSPTVVPTNQRPPLLIGLVCIRFPLDSFLDVSINFRPQEVKRTVISNDTSAKRSSHLLGFALLYKV